MIFSLKAVLISPAAYTSTEEYDMEGIVRKLACCMLLLALAGTVSGAGYTAAENAGIAVPGNHPAASSMHGDRGLLSLTGNPHIGDPNPAADIRVRCFFPLWRLPEYYICIMFCKIGGGGNSCAPGCEAKLTICTIS
jgi:hypothetical protein